MDTISDRVGHARVVIVITMTLESGCDYYAAATLILFGRAAEANGARYNARDYLSRAICKYISGAAPN